jgi:hypothetical protein
MIYSINLTDLMTLNLLSRIILLLNNNCEVHQIIKVGSLNIKTRETITEGICTLNGGYHFNLRHFWTLLVKFYASIIPKNNQKINETKQKKQT